MAKVAKQTQTDYTRGGKAISDTSIPLYQQTLTSMGEYNANPTSYIDDYLKKYYSNTSDQSDFLRNYQRAVSDMTGSNYAATSGGYASRNQQNYDDTQRYYNDLASRMQSQNVANAANLAQQQYNNLLSATDKYYNAYGLGKPYSDVEQYNYIADQANSFWNQLGGMSTAVGQGLSAIPNPWTMAIGGALQAGGNLMSVDTDTAFKALRGGDYNNQQQQNNMNAIGKTTQGLTESLMDLFNKKNATGGSSTPSNSLAGVDLSKPQSLYNVPQYKFSWQQ